LLPSCNRISASWAVSMLVSYLNNGFLGKARAGLCSGFY